VRSSLGVLGEAFIGAGVEWSGQGRQRNGWRWWGSFNGFGRFSIEGGAKRVGRGTVLR
jgi:hypothetical protein